MEHIHRLLILIQIFSILVARPTNADDEDSSVTMEMKHRHSLPGAPESKADRLRELIKNDAARQNMIMANQRRRTLEANNPSVELKMFPATDFGQASYFVDFNVGSPFQKFAVVVDTGSDLTWMQCRAKCRQNCTADGKMDGKRVLIGDRSSSFKPVPCSSEMCILDLLPTEMSDACPTPATICPYYYKYVEDGMSAGYLVTEEVALFTANREKLRLSNVLIGCSQESNIDFADGVLGLGYAKLSFPLNTVSKFGGKFSYCLVDHMKHRTAVNYLVFGSKRTRASAVFKNKNLRYTALDVTSNPPFYSLQVIGFTFDGKFLMDIPSAAWDPKKDGGVIIDSGMSLTQLTSPVYGSVMKVFEKALGKYPKVKLPEDKVPMKFCFNSTEFEPAKAPKFMIHFGDTARFEPHVKSYIIDVLPQVSCLGFQETPWPGVSVIGNILQQNHLWEFDLIAKKLGFAPSLCAE